MEYEMTFEDHIEREVLSLRHAMDDFLAWARRRGYPEVETLLDQYQAELSSAARRFVERMREVGDHFCPHCNDTGMIWIEGARSFDNPEGDYQTRCVCADTNPQLRNDEVPY